jgi:lipoprotein-anchoring transpeptidase ErfK/SrfK
VATEGIVAAASDRPDRAVLQLVVGGGIVGLHGTNDPTSIGRRVSHGCIRMRNADIRALVRILPLGTLVTIR